MARHREIPDPLRPYGALNEARRSARYLRPGARTWAARTYGDALREAYAVQLAWFADAPSPLTIARQLGVIT